MTAGHTVTCCRVMCTQPSSESARGPLMQRHLCNANDVHWQVLPVICNACIPTLPAQASVVSLLEEQPVQKLHMNNCWPTLTAHTAACWWPLFALVTKHTTCNMVIRWTLSPGLAGTQSKPPFCRCRPALSVTAWDPWAALKQHQNDSQDTILNRTPHRTSALRPATFDANNAKS